MCNQDYLCNHKNKEEQCLRCINISDKYLQVFHCDNLPHVVLLLGHVVKPFSSILKMFNSIFVLET